VRCDRATAATDADQHLICEADRLRDVLQYAEAAEAYAAVLAIAPERTDIWVQ